MTELKHTLHLVGMLNAERVLVIDDDGEFVESLRDLLVDGGCSVETAHDARTALEQLARFRPHVALIDVRLGTEGGTALLATLRAQASDLVCILMSANSALDSAFEVGHGYADDYPRKPINPAALIELVHGSARRVREQRERAQRERMQQLDTLAASTAQDLNNILTIVLAEASDLRVQLAPPSQDSLRLIEDSTRRAVDIARKPKAGASNSLPNPARAVLICDDDPLILRLLRRLLANLGYSVTTAGSVDEAVTAFDSGPERFDVLVTDLRLGQQSGVELVQRLRARRPDLGILLVSGDMGASDAFGDAERISYLPKPFTAQELTHALDALNAGIRPD